MYSRPHAVSVSLPLQTIVSGVPGVVSHPSAETDYVQITPMAASTAFDSAGIEVSRPHQLLTIPESRDLYAVNGLVTWGSRTFAVKSPPVVFEALPVARSCTVILSEITKIL